MAKKTKTSEPVLNIDELAMEFENGEASVSMSNLMKSMETHGFIVGAIFSFSPREDASTKFFFSDGTVQTVYGFMAGKKCEDIQAIVGLKMALSLVPGIAPRIEGDYLIENVLREEDMKQAIDEEEYVTLHYLFRPPIEVPEMIQSTRGFYVFEKAIEIIATDPHSKAIEGEW